MTMSTRGTAETGTRGDGRDDRAGRADAGGDRGGGGRPVGLSAAELDQAARLARELVATVDRVVAGQRDVAEVAAACLLSSGHLLIEDIPGVGKTLLAQVIAAAVGGTFHRIQGTPDLLPGDVTGSMVPEHDSFRLRFRPGPVFANVVVFDELNRTNPRTQSALLEAAEEATVSIDGTTYPLPDPFMLVATQNPIELAGTYRLGEGALDRFAAVVSPGRAGFDDEVDVLIGRRGRKLLHDVTPIATLDTVVACRRAVERVHVPEPVARYVVELLEVTREHQRVRLGASTRGGVALVGLAKALAVMRGRGYVVPDDVAGVTVPALAHRVLVVDAGGSTGAGRDVVSECLGRVRPPSV
jgi:MoxR-like ATPase